MGFSRKAGTWRIIPVSKWLITMVSKSPKWDCSPYKWPIWYDPLSRKGAAEISKFARVGKGEAV